MRLALFRGETQLRYKEVARSSLLKHKKTKLFCGQPCPCSHHSRGTHTDHGPASSPGPPDHICQPDKSDDCRETENKCPEIQSRTWERQAGLIHEINQVYEQSKNKEKDTNHRQHDEHSVTQ